MAAEQRKRGDFRKHPEVSARVNPMRIRITFAGVTSPTQRRNGLKGDADKATTALLQSVGHVADNVGVVILLREKDGTIPGFPKHNEALIAVRLSGGR